MKPNLRRCVSCRKVAPRSTFWRVLRLPQTGQVQLDHGMGRSAYVCPTGDCLRQAQKKKRLERALRVPIAPALYQVLWQRLETASTVSTDSVATHSQNAS